MTDYLILILLLVVIVILFWLGRSYAAISTTEQWQEKIPKFNMKDYLIPNHIDWVHDVEIVDTREDIMKEAAVEQYGNDTCRAAEHFMKGMEYAFDYALQEAKHVIIEYFGIDDKYADMVEELFNRLDERLGR